MRTTLLAFIFLGLWSCSDDDTSIRYFKDNPSITSLNGTWKVISFEDFTTYRAEYKTQENSWTEILL